MDIKNLIQSIVPVVIIALTSLATIKPEWAWIGYVLAGLSGIYNYFTTESGKKPATSTNEAAK